jgi:hypothetical protein
MLSMPNIIHLIGSSVPIIVGLTFLLKRRKLMSLKYRADGEAVGLHTSGDDTYVTIRFVTITGEVVVKKYGVSQISRKVGDKMPLYYNPDKPTDFVVDSMAEKWLPVIFIVAGFIFIILLFTVFRDGTSKTF